MAVWGQQGRAETARSKGGGERRRMGAVILFSLGRGKLVGFKIDSMDQGIMQSKGGWVEVQCFEKRWDEQGSKGH